MEPSIINQFRLKLANDPDNQAARRIFHETYEWIEGYLGKSANNQIDAFCTNYNNFYWDRADIKEIARQYGFYPPVASSGFNFEPTPQIQQATYFLKYRAGLDVTAYVDEEESVKSVRWKKSGLIALFYIVKQVRDNLFHGQKMDIEELQYERNKVLVSLAGQFTSIILDNLDAAQASIAV